MRRAAVVLAVVAALAATACTASPHHKSAQPTHHLTPSSTVAPIGLLAVVSSRLDRLHAPGAPTIISGDEVRFSTGGSGTCPPIVRSASRHGDTLVLSVDADNAGRSGCTLDLRSYVVEAKFNQQVFDDPTLRYIKYGYFGKGKRVALKHAA